MVKASNDEKRKCQGLYGLDPFKALTKEQYENFDVLLKPRNSSKSAKDVSLTKAVDLVIQNFDKLNSF
jgi:hypothetical protein